MSSNPYYSSDPESVEVLGEVDRVREQIRALWLSFGLVLVCLPIYRFLLPDGLSLWVVLVGLLPGLPFAVLAWRVSRS